MSGLSEIIIDPKEWSKIKEETTLDDAISHLASAVNRMPKLLSSEVMYGKIKRVDALKKYAAIDYALKVLVNTRNKMGYQADLFNENEK